MNKRNHYNEVIHILQELHKTYPTYNLGKHLATALDEYGDIWGMTDKELEYALYKYKTQLEMDVPHTDDSELDRIIKDAMDLDNILKQDDDEEEDY